MKRLLVQTQLSNIVNGRFDLACDSGWNMCIGRIREMLKLNPDLYVDVMGPTRDQDDMDGQGQLVVDPNVVNPDLWAAHGVSGDNRLKYIPHWIEPNALATRYDFNYQNISYVLELELHKHFSETKYDAIYLNDPMQFRAFKAMFFLKGGYVPRFYVHSHFVDLPSNPKFPVEASLWLGQLEAAMRSDWNFWQCASTLAEFECEARKTLVPSVVDEIMAKSSPWDDGYSSSEITSPVNMDNVRFTAEEFDQKTAGKTILFFPNRISMSSGDYTNGMKFMFELLPQLRKQRHDFVVIAGNPNQKFSNAELEEKCGVDGYVKLTPSQLNRDEFKFVASRAHIAIGLYGNDAYGGTAARECIELGCMPLWIDVNEYSSIAREVKYPFLAKADFSDFVAVSSVLIEHAKAFGRASPWTTQLHAIVKRRCSYEQTTAEAMKRMDLL